MRPPRVLIADGYEGMSRVAAEMVDETVRDLPAIFMALPTGATPVGMYEGLVALYRERGTDWSAATVFNLDEYVGVGQDDPESYAHYMRRHLFDHVNLTAARCHLPDGLAPDPAKEAVEYEARIDAGGGIDLAILGIGPNGHIGFNEPGETLTAATHVATLAEETWQRNFPALAAAPPADDARKRYREAYTMGIGTILRARRIMLLASGEEKRDVLRDAFEGPVTTANPASLLQLSRDVTLVLDRTAAGSQAG